MQSTDVALVRRDVSAIDIILPLTAFAVPFLVSGPQWLTGTLVNAFLVLVAFRSRWTTRSVVVLPSIAAVLHGALFGPFTPFLAYFLPAIWLANAVFVGTVAGLMARTHWALATVVGAALKASLLFLAALLCLRIGIVPELFVRSMGIMQFLTAVAGGLIAFGVLGIAQRNAA